MPRYVAYLALLFGILLVASGCYRSITPISKKDSLVLQKNLSQLANQTLVVRLYTNNPKRRILVDNGLTKQVQKHDEERQEYVTTMMKVWTDNYDYSKLRFIPDSLYTAWIAGDKIPVFINADGEIDGTLTVKTDHYAVLGRGSRDYAFVWLDSGLKPWQPQPPINYDRMSIWELFMGTEEVLTKRIETINTYFHTVDL